MSLQRSSRRGFSVKNEAELDLAELRCLAEGEGKRCVKTLDASSNGVVADRVIACSHCKEESRVCEDALLFCELPGCPAAYHGYCIDAAVAAAVAQKPELINSVILCPVCSLRGLEPTREGAARR